LRIRTKRRRRLGKTAKVLTAEKGRQAVNPSKTRPGANWAYWIDTTHAAAQSTVWGAAASGLAPKKRTTEKLNTFTAILVSIGINIYF
jgi:hypothetical protein